MDDGPSRGCEFRARGAGRIGGASEGNFGRSEVPGTDETFTGSDMCLVTVDPCAWAVLARELNGDTVFVDVGVSFVLLELCLRLPMTLSSGVLRE
jgi:hypothetical protein